MKLRLGTSKPDGLLEVAREWHLLKQEGEALLGPAGWRLLRGYGKLTEGPYAGQYVSALSVEEIRALLKALQGGARIPVHLMHRHRSGYSETSGLSLHDGRLLMHYADRTEGAE